MTILYGPAQGEAKKINKLYGGAVVMTSLNRDTSVQTVLVTAIDEDKFAKKFSVWAGGAGKGVFVNDEITAIKIEHSSSSSTSDYAFFLTGVDSSVPGGQKDVRIFGNSYTPMASVTGQWGITITSSNVPVVDNIPVSPTYADQSWKITRMYGPAGTIVSEVTGEIQPGGDGNVVAFNGETFSEAVKSMTYFWELLSATADQISLGISHLNNFDYYSIKIYSNGQYINKSIDSGGADRMALYGITISDTPTTGGIDYIDLTRNGYSPMAKLIYQGFGHYDYGYGILTYFTDANHTQTNMVELSSYNLRRLSGYYSSTRQTWNVTINGVTISNKDIYGVILTNKVTSLPPYFLSGCEALNSPLKLPPTLTSISDSGEANGSAFLFACKNMLAPIDVGSLSPSIVKSITPHSFSASDANAPAYTIGMTIVGANRAEWLSAFPNQGALIYRKLIDGGY